MKSGPIVAASITDRLTAAIGIDPGALDPGRLKWIINSRCRALALPDADSYAAYLEQTPHEIDALIDEVVVPETRFFRDPVVFEHIRRALTHLASEFPGPIRILSAPCGTGQEAWSLAALATMAGLQPERFQIDGFDISLAALAFAERGIYPEQSLAHVSSEFQRAIAARSPKQWHVHDALRARISFQRRNLAQPGALGQEPLYHLILCRNLFIYLGAESRTALAQSLATALIPGGRLFLGTADRVEELSAHFAPMRPAASFAFHHRASVSTPKSSPEPLHRPLRAPSIAPLRWVGTQPPAPPPSTARDLYTQALDHRQQNDLARAERRCRQALYLAPDFLPAMELLQSLWSENPNLRLRRALRDRILRAAPLTTASEVSA